MATVNRVEKKVIMTKWDIIKYQILTHCYLKKILLSDADLECLTLLSITGPIELTYFCYDASEEYNIFKSSQTVRNCINKCEKFELVIKDPDNKKLIRVNDNLRVQTEGLIMLDFKMLSKDEPQKT